MTKTHYIRLYPTVSPLLESLCGLKDSYQNTKHFVVRGREQPTCLTCQKLEKKEKDNA